MTSIFQIPCEIRLMIYEYLFQPITLLAENGAISATTIPSSKDLSLLLACQQFYQEAREIAFKNLTLDFTSELSTFWKAPQPASFPKSLVRSLFFGVERPGSRRTLYKRVFSLFRIFPALEFIVLLSDHGKPIDCHLMLSMVAMQNLRARILRNKKADLCVRYQVNTMDHGISNLSGWKLTRHKGDNFRSCHLLFCDVLKQEASKVLESDLSQET
ncbi:hypothetical protein B0J11DRAFT_521747 [Dendryphion nanum]|uniref:F-box domain-containing protein n=1 Tax=Dendryphion nanum TaxID=256645 RepID=A0A9P9E7P8_9PLEO|nr:hypothetical protein B0J11DRAFT_521747 [Dendryphion nanum]